MKYNQMAILTDVTKCIGCEECVKACQQVNDLPKERPWRWVRRIDDLSSARWTTLIKRRGEQDDRFIRLQCRHCLEPSCVSACIVGALRKTDEGAVVYNRDICIGCRYCMIACPWDIPRYSWEDTVPYVQKCHLCHERVTQENKPPACTEVCPTGATIFGARDELLREAHRRIAAEPDRYIQKVWGEKEVGGTSVLYISDIDLKLTDLEKPITESAAMPHRTTKILHQMPLVFCAMAGLMGGISWIVKRRQMLMADPEPGVGGDGRDTAEVPREGRGGDRQDDRQDGQPDEHRER